MNTSVGTNPLVLFQYPGDHERTRIRMIRYVGFFLTWQSVPIIHQVPLNLNSKLVTPKSENCWNSMFWTVQSKQRQRQYHRTVRSLDLEYLVANSWCLQKPYPAKPWASSKSQRWSVGPGNTAAKVFQERVREPLGYYCSRTSSTTHSNACLWLGSKNVFLPQSEASIYRAAFVVFLYEISSIGALFFICLANMLNYGISLILGVRFHWNSSRRTLPCTTQTGSANRRVCS